MLSSDILSFLGWWKLVNSDINRFQNVSIDYSQMLGQTQRWGRTGFWGSGVWARTSPR